MRGEMSADIASTIRTAREHSIADLLRRSARRCPNKTAIICGGVVWSFAEMDAICDRLGRGLLGLGIAQGDRVAVLSRNSHAFAALRFAVARIGAVLVPINFMLNPDEISFILANSGAKIAHDQRDSAFYSRSSDSIHLPLKETFKDAPGYYGTALHELAHWTGHPSRLNRPTLNDSYRFGDFNYAKEELRAELASVFIAAEVGVPHDPANHAAYVGSWIKALKEDKNEIFRAAHDASAATDFVLSLEREVSRAEALEAGNPAATDIDKAQALRDETGVLENDRDLVASAYRGLPAEAAQKDGGQGEDTRFVARFEPQTGTVAVHDKRLGTDNHTPVEALTAPEKASPDGWSPSFAAARNITAEKLGDAARTFPAQTQSGNYRGEIIGETELHVVQRLSPQTAIAHLKHLLQSVPRVGDNVGIGYANELGSVKASRERSRTQELAR